MINKFSISAAIGAASVVAILAFGTSGANAKSISACYGTNGSSVISCCEKIVANKGKPHWMMQGSLTCREVVKCIKSSNRCYIQLRTIEHSNDGRTGEDRSPQAT